MFSGEASSAAMKDGFTFACSMCEHLHAARARGLPGCMAGHLGKDCRGPFGEHGYPHYKGPLTRVALAGLCFVCGAPADASVFAGPPDDRLNVGCCKKHIPLLSSVTKKGDPPKILRDQRVVGIVDR